MHVHAHTLSPQNTRGSKKNIKYQSQEKFHVHLQGRTGHVELEAGDDVRVEDSETPDALPLHKHLRTATREKGGV